MKSLFNRLAGVAVVGVVLYSCASIGRPEGGAIDEFDRLLGCYSGQ